MERITKKGPGIYVFDNKSKTEEEYVELENKMVQNYGRIEDLEELTDIPFAQIASLKVGDKVYVSDRSGMSEGAISSLNFNKLTVTILVGKTFIDYMMFHQYGEDRQSPVHCWHGAWALTKEELGGTKKMYFILGADSQEDLNFGNRSFVQILKEKYDIFGIEAFNAEEAIAKAKEISKKKFFAVAPEHTTLHWGIGELA